MRTRLGSLRWRLAALAFVGTVIPLGVLLVLVLTVDNGTVIQRDATNVTVDQSEGVSPWVPIAAAALTVPAAAMAWRWSRQAVEPIEAITDAANRIQSGSLDERLAIHAAPTEIQALADSFDAMLDRLARASTVQRGLIEQTSHELRTPLAALALNAELILTEQDATIDQHRASAQRTSDLVGRLQQTLEAQLTSARDENLSAEQTDNDLTAVAQRAIDAVQTTYPQAMIHLHSPGPVIVAMESHGVELALRNLIDNAVRHSPTEEAVIVSIHTDPGHASVSVTDTGPGIPAADHAHVFDRTYTTHPDGPHGHGLGLAVVKQVATAHGHLELSSPLPGNTIGTRFTLTVDAGTAAWSV